MSGQQADDDDDLDDRAWLCEWADELAAIDAWVSSWLTDEEIEIRRLVITGIVQLGWYLADVEGRPREC